MWGGFLWLARWVWRFCVFGALGIYLFVVGLECEALALFGLLGGCDGELGGPDGEGRWRWC